MKRLYYTIIFVLCSWPTVAQSTRTIKVNTSTSPEVISSPATLLSSFNLAEVPTGFLLEAGFEYLDLTTVDGDINKDYKADILSLRRIMSSMESMDVTGLRQWDTIPLPSMSSNPIPVTIALYEYNKISQTAWNQGLITYSNGQLHPDASATTSELYDTLRVVTFAPSVCVIEDNPVYLSFRFADNCNLSYTSISVDLGDGQGFRSILEGTSLLFTPITSGLQTLTAKVATQTGDLYAYSYFLVKESIPQKNLSTYPSNAIPLTYHTNSGSDITAKVSYSAATGTNPEHKTFIVVEGFDPLFSTSLLGYSSGDLGFNNLWNTFDYNGNTIVNNYDIYYVDWLNSEADIRDNAQLLKLVISFINDQRHSIGSTERSVILAKSMGGLITQIALREMEIDEETHEIDHVFFDDVPFKGVNIPPGVVMAYQSLNSYFNSTVLGIVSLITGDSAIFSEIHRYLYGKSVQQMSINYIDPNGYLYKTPFSVLQNRLGQLGMPKGDVGHPIMIHGISDGGSTASITEALTYTGNSLFSLSCDGEIISFLLNLLSPFTGMGFYWGYFFNGNVLAHILSFLPGISKIHYELTALPNDGTNEYLSYFKGVYTNRILGILDISSTFIEESKQASNQMEALDRGYGSLYEIITPGHDGVYVDTTFTYSDTSFVNAEAHLKMVKNIHFVPSFSSLCVSEPDASIERDYYTNPIMGFKTAFDSYCLPENNVAQDHTMNIPWNWVIERIDDQSFISAPDTVYIGQGLEVVNCNKPIRWFCDAPYYVRINSSSGVVTSISDTTGVTFVAYHYSNGEYYSKKKSVVAVPPEFPPLYITCGADENGMYVELNSPDLDYEEYLDECIPSPISWYYNIDSGILQMSNETTRKFYIEDYVSDAYDWLHITARVQDSVYPRPQSQQYLGFDVWCRKRLNWLFPRKLLYENGQLYMLIFDEEDGMPFDSDMPLVFYYDTSFPPRYTDQSITDTLTLRIDDDILITQTIEEGFWNFPVFCNALVMSKINQILQNLGQTGVDFLRMTILNSNELVIKEFIIPIIKRTSI